MATATRSTSAGANASFPGGSAVPSTNGTGRVGSPVATARATSTLTTSDTGLTAASPTSRIWAWSAGSTTAACTKATGTSNGSPTARGTPTDPTVTSSLTDRSPAP